MRWLLPLILITGAPRPVLGSTQAPAPPGVVQAIQDLSPRSGADADLEKLATLVRDRRIVLLGENGHGVEEFSALKVRLIEHLHRHHGFNVVAFESGFHECREANAALAAQPARRALQDCLIVQLHHLAIEPLLEYARRSRESARPLRIAGIDLQIQGWSSATRPTLFRAALGERAPRLGDSIAVFDSTLIELTFQSADSVRRFVLDRGMVLRAAYDSGAALTGGDTSWTFRAGAELMRRELYRAAATVHGLEPPSDVYAIRDRWMAETIARIAEADSTAKLVVWLHNDHARYGAWQAGPYHIRAAGGLLKERFGEDVASVGFLMGGGTFADNFRRERSVAEAPPGSIERVMMAAGYRVALLPLTGGVGAPVRDWADESHPYIRGQSVATMRPGREFDAVVLVASVSPARYPPR